MLFQCFVKDFPALVVNPLYAITGKLRAVEDKRRILNPGRRHINPHLDVQGKILVKIMNSLPHILDPMLNILIFHCGNKMIIVQPGQNSMGKRIPQDTGNAPQEFIAILKTIFPIITFEILYIKIQEAYIPIARIFQQIIGIFHKVHHVKQTSNFIDLIFSNYIFHNRTLISELIHRHIHKVVDMSIILWISCAFIP